MTDADRAALRRLQDAFLALPHVRRMIELHGEDEPLAMGWPGRPWPTYRQVREALYPDLGSWFRDFFRGDDRGTG